ncbi:beta-1,6-N-acetylglucosaminyltransferase [Niabella aquatica]
MMKICHLILAHKNPQQLKRLTQALAHSCCHVFLCIDKKTDETPFRTLLSDAPNVFFIKNRVKVHWGGRSIIMAIVHAIEEIKSSGTSYDFINLISAQDYPIKPMQELIDYLNAHKKKNFISYITEQNDERKWIESSRARFNRYHFTDFNFKGKYLVQNFLNWLLPPRKHPAFSQFYGGNCSTWWILDAECAYFIAQSIQKNARLKRYIKFTWGIDEILFPTLIMNSHFASSTENNNFRYIDWSEGNAHPKILTSTDFDALAASDHFFARKFDTAIDSTVLDLIDTRILNKKPYAPLQPIDKS